MAEKLEVGDVVRLRGGGPKMTVVQVLEDSVRCTWFVDDSKIEQKAFPPGALKKDEGLAVA